MTLSVDLKTLKEYLTFQDSLIIRAVMINQTYLTYASLFAL